MYVYIYTHTFTLTHINTSPGFSKKKINEFVSHTPFLSNTACCNAWGCAFIFLLLNFLFIFLFA